MNENTLKVIYVVAMCFIAGYTLFTNQKADVQIGDIELTVNGLSQLDSLSLPE